MIIDQVIGVQDYDILILLAPFRQVETKSPTRIREGAGLGLSIIASMVNVHGGTMKMESMVGHGT